MVTPYLQSFLFTMETGRVLLVTVSGEDAKHGEGLAHSGATEFDGGQVWDFCAYPVSLREAQEGVTEFAPVADLV